ncbi:MAG: hypothetical protein ACI4S9_05115 [Christensenellales bacterium]
MKKLICVLLMFGLLAGCCACGGENVDNLVKLDRLYSGDFGGLGVEWDAYEHPSLISEEKWAQIIERMDKLKPNYVRCMINYSWFTKNPDTKGTETKDDDTWEYYWTNESIVNMFRILDYCNENGIDVALGPWRGVDAWGMEAKDLYDVRWAKVTRDLFLKITDEGYTCVKWFVPTNEPNYLSGNSFELWESGVRNVYGLFGEAGLLDKVSILGTDVSSFSAAEEWSEKIGSVKDMLTNYSVHLYLSDYVVDNGRLTERIENLVKIIKEKDASFGKNGKDLFLWECGLIDGRSDEVDSNELIDTVEYGFRMTDLTVQAIAGGVNGLVYWELDDAQHFLPTGGNGTWGMFSSLGDAEQQELRPWFSSSMLLTNILKKGAKIYGAAGNGDKDGKVRAVAAVSDDGKNGGLVIVNQGTREVTGNYYVPEKISPADGKLYVYIYGGDTLKLDGNGYVIPNAVIDGSLNKALELSVPAKSAVFVSTEKI